MKKKCKKCGEWKDEESEFYVDSRSKKTPKSRMGSCKLCVLAANRAWAEANPEKKAAISTSWRSRNRGRASEVSRAWQIRNPEKFRASIYRRKYSVDFEDLWESQKGKCALCHEPMLREGRDFVSACVDHDRSCCSGKKSCGQCVRGLIHWGCNMLLGYAKDNPDVLKHAIDYLEQWELKKGNSRWPPLEAD